jgi:hypothetical protein
MKMNYDNLIILGHSIITNSATYDYYSHKNSIFKKWKRLRKNVLKSLAVLNSEITLSIHSDLYLPHLVQYDSDFDYPPPERFKELNFKDRQGCEIAKAFVTLDKLSFFAVGLGAVCKQQEEVASLLKEVDSILYKVIEEIFYPRLIPLNEHRKMMLQYISKDWHYMFPWYTDWNDVPNSTLEVIQRKLMGGGLDTSQLSYGIFAHFVADVDREFRIALIADRVMNILLQ